MATGKLFNVALTGGIASGKSTVAALFAQLGVTVIDLDVIAREVVAPGSGLLERIIERFGEGLRAPDGGLKRRELREIVFINASSRAWLEALLHPAIHERAAQQRAQSLGPYVITVVPLLAESKSAQAYDRVLLVDCDEQLQRARLSARDQVSAAMVDATLAAQAGRAARRALADDVIENNGAPQALLPKVQELHKRYLLMARGTLK